jgi:hypothetical protein
MPSEGTVQVVRSEAFNLLECKKGAPRAPSLLASHLEFKAVTNDGLNVPHLWWVLFVAGAVESPAPKETDSQWDAAIVKPFACSDWRPKNFIGLPEIFVRHRLAPPISIIADRRARKWDPVISRS